MVVGRVFPPEMLRLEGRVTTEAKGKGTVREMTRIECEYYALHVHYDCDPYDIIHVAIVDGAATFAKDLPIYKEAVEQARLHEAFTQQYKRAAIIYSRIRALADPDQVRYYRELQNMPER